MNHNRLMRRGQDWVPPSWGSMEKYRGAMIILYCGIVNGVKNKNIKNSLGAMWNASHLTV